jgi:hypothetical protein
LVGSDAWASLATPLKTLGLNLDIASGQPTIDQTDEWRQPTAPLEGKEQASAIGEEGTTPVAGDVRPAA